MKKLLLSVLIAAITAAATPKTISYQGVLTDSEGNPKPSNSYDITFSLYDQESAGIHRWRCSKKVPVEEGFFNVTLGSDTLFPADLDFSQQYWLGIQVGEAAELTPRVALTASGYAIRSSVADSSVVATLADSSVVAGFATTAGSVQGDEHIPFMIGASEKMRITPNGYVGIGDTIPVSKLVVREDLNNEGPQLRVYNQNSGDSSAAKLWIEGNSNNIQLIAYGDNHATKANTSALMSTATGTELILGTHAKEQIRIDTDGNVGIGTAEPDNKLFVVGDASEGNASSGNIFSLGTSIDKRMGMGVNANGDGWIQPRLKDLLLAPHGGNVGIGTTAPIKKLDVNGAVQASSFLINGTPVGISTDTYWSPAGSGNIQYSGGNVGIGNSNPIAHLHIGDGESASGTYKDFRMQADTTSFRIVSYDPHHATYIQFGENFSSNSSSDLHFSNISAQKIFMTLKDNGNVGIGTPSPTEKLEVAGNIKASGTITPSDERYKENIEVLTTPVKKIKAVRGVSYDLKTEDFPEKNFSEKKQIGVIAQEVEKVLPELVHTDSEGYKAVAYDKLTAVLIEAVKEQQTTIEELQKANEAQKLHNEELTARLSALEALIKE